MMSGPSTYKLTARSRTASESSESSSSCSRSSSKSVIAKQCNALATGSDSQSDNGNCTEKTTKKKTKKRRKNEYFFSSRDLKKNISIKLTKKKLLYQMQIRTKLKDNRIPVVLLTRLKNDHNLSLPKKEEAEKEPVKILPKISKYEIVMKSCKKQSRKVPIERRRSGRLSQCEDSQSDFEDNVYSSSKESDEEEDKVALNRVQGNLIKQCDRKTISDNSAESSNEAFKRSTSVKTSRTSVNNSDQIPADSSDDCKKSVSLYVNKKVIPSSVDKTSVIFGHSAVTKDFKTKKEVVEQSSENVKESIKNPFNKPASVSDKAMRISLNKAEEISKDNLSTNYVNKIITEVHEKDFKNLNERFRSSKKSIESKKLSYDQTDSKSNDKVLRNISKPLENLFISSLINVENFSLNKLAQKIDPKIFRYKPVIRIDRNEVDSILKKNRSFNLKVKSSENLSETVSENHSKILNGSEISDSTNLNSASRVIIQLSVTKQDEGHGESMLKLGELKLQDIYSKIETVESITPKVINTRNKSIHKKINQSEEAAEIIEPIITKNIKNMKSKPLSKKMFGSEDKVESYPGQIVEISNKSPLKKATEIVDIIVKDDMYPKKPVGLRGRPSHKNVDVGTKKLHEKTEELKELVLEIESLSTKSIMNRSPIKRIVEPDILLEKIELPPQKEESVVNNLNCTVEKIDLPSEKTFKTRSRFPMKKMNPKDVASFHTNAVESENKFEMSSKKSVMTRSKSPYKKIESESLEKIDSSAKKIVAIKNKSLLKKAIEIIENDKVIQESKPKEKIEIITDKVVVARHKSLKKATDIVENIKTANKKAIELEAATILSINKNTVNKNLSRFKKGNETTKVVESSLEATVAENGKIELPTLSVLIKSKSPPKKSIDITANILASQREEPELEEKIEVHSQESVATRNKFSLKKAIDTIENIDSLNKEIVTSTENSESRLKNLIALQKKLPHKLTIEGKDATKSELSLNKINEKTNKKIKGIKKNMGAIESPSEIIETRNKFAIEKTDEAKENVEENESPLRRVNEADSAMEGVESPFKKYIETKNNFSIKKAVDMKDNIQETECCSQETVKTKTKPSKKSPGIKEKNENDEKIESSPQKTIVIRRRSSRHSSTRSEDILTESRDKSKDKSSNKLFDEKTTAVYSSDQTNVILSQNCLSSESKIEENIVEKSKDIDLKKLNGITDLHKDSIENQKSDKNSDQKREVTLKKSETNVEIISTRVAESNAILNEKVSNNERVLELHGESQNKDLDNSSDSHKENRPCRRSTRHSSQNNDENSTDIMNGVCFNSDDNINEDVHNNSQMLEECTDNCLDKTLESNVIFNHVQSDIDHVLAENDLKSVENLVIDSIINGDVVSPKIIMQSAVPKADDIQTFVFGHADLGTVVDFVSDIGTTKNAVVDAAPDPNLGAGQAEQPDHDVDNLMDCRRKAALLELKKKCTDNLDKKRQAEFDRITAEILEDDSVPPTIPSEMSDIADHHEIAPLEMDQIQTDSMSTNFAENTADERTVSSDDESNLSLRLARFQRSRAEAAQGKRTRAAEKQPKRPTKFICSQCDEVCNSNRELKKHVKELHRQRLVMKITKTEENNHVTSMIEEPAENGLSPLPAITGQETLLADPLEMKDQITEGEIKMIVAKENGTRNSHIVKEIKITPKTPESCNSARISGYSPASSEMSSGNSSCRVPNYSPAKPELSGSTGFALPGWSPARSEPNQPPVKRKPGRPRKYPIFTETELIAKRMASLRHNEMMGAGKFQDLDFTPVESILEPGLTAAEPIIPPITVSPRVKAGLIAKLNNRTENSLQERTTGNLRSGSKRRRRRRRTLSEENSLEAPKVTEDSISASVVKRRRSQSQESNVDVPLPPNAQDQNVPESVQFAEPVVQVEKKPKIISDVVVPGEKKINISLVRRTRKRSQSQDNSIDVPLPATQEEEKEEDKIPDIKSKLLVSRDHTSEVDFSIKNAAIQEGKFTTIERRLLQDGEQPSQNSKKVKMPLLNVNEENQSEAEDRHSVTRGRNELNVAPELAEEDDATSQSSDASAPVFQEVKNSEIDVAEYFSQDEEESKGALNNSHEERIMTRGRSRTLSQSSFLDVPSLYFERKFDVAEYFVQNEEIPKIESIVEDMVLQHDQKVQVRRGRRRAYSQSSSVDVPMIEDFEKEINVNVVTKERERTLSYSSTSEIPMFEDVEKEIEVNVLRREQIRPMSREEKDDSSRDLLDDDNDSGLGDPTSSLGSDALSRYHITKELVVQLTKIDTVPKFGKDANIDEEESFTDRPKRTLRPNSVFNEFETMRLTKRQENNNNDTIDKCLVNLKQHQLTDETLDAASTSKETSESLGIPELQMEDNQITVSENQLVPTPRREVINKTAVDESQEAKLEMIMNATTPNETMANTDIPKSVVQNNVVQNNVVQQPLMQQQLIVQQPFMQQPIMQQRVMQHQIIQHQVVQQVIQPQQFCILFIPDQLSYSSEASARDATPTATIVNFQPVPDAEVANKPLIFTPTTPTKILSVEDSQLRTYICRNCAQVLDLMGRLEAMVGMMEEDKNLIKCPFCSNHFQSVFYLEYHMRQEHLKCENEKQCRHSSVNSLRIPTHETTSDSETYITFALKCRSCYEIFSTVQQLNDHVMQKHKTLVRFKPVPTSSLSPTGVYQPPAVPPKNGTRMPVVQCPSDCVCRIGIRSTDTPQQRQLMLKRCPYAMRRLEKIESAAYEVYTCTLCKSTFLMKDEVVDHLMKMHEVSCKFPCYTCLTSFRALQLQEKHHCSETTLKDLDKLLNIAILPTNVGEKNNSKYLEDSPSSADELLRPVKPNTESPGTPQVHSTRNGLKRKNGEVLANLNRFLGPSEPKKFKSIGRHRKRPCPKCDKKFAYRKHLFNHIIIEHVVPEEKSETPKRLIEELFALVGSGMLSGQRINELAELLGQYKDSDGVTYRTITMVDDREFWRSGYEEVGEFEMIQCIQCREYFKTSEKLPRNNDDQMFNQEFDKLCNICDTRSNCGPKTRRRSVINNGYHQHNGLNGNAEHSKMIHRYSCKDCGETFVSLIELKTHKRLAHGKTYQDRLHDCENCKKSFISSRMLEKHKKHFAQCRVPLAKKEETKSEIQNQRGESETNNSLDTSENTDSSNRRDSSDCASSQEQSCQLRCSFCDCICTSEVSLKNHLKRSHGRKASICQFCNGLLINTNEVRHMLDNHIVPIKSNPSRRNGYLREQACTIEDIDELIRALGKHRLQSLMVYHDFEGKCNKAIMHCPSCPEMFASRESCRFHYVWTHDNTCLLCDEVFRSGSIACQHKVQAHTSAASYLWCIQRLVTAIVNTLKLDPGQPSLVICQELISRLEEQEEEERLLLEAQAIACESAAAGEEATGERFLEVLSEDQLPDSGNMIEVVIGKEDSEDDLLSMLNLSPNYESSCASEQSLPNPDSAPPEQVEAEEPVIEPPAPAPSVPAPPPAPSPVATETYVSSGVCKINTDTGEEQLVLIVTDEDLVTYRDNIGDLAQKISTTCDSLTLDDITEMLRAYFENVNNAAA